MRVSIVICNFNYARFLEGAIHSAVTQDHPDTEVIVVDDGSTDGSREIIERCAGTVTAIYKPNGGQISAYNAGFSRVTGDVVVFLDSDDALDPSASTCIVRAFGPGVVKVHYRLRLVDEDGAMVGSSIPFRLDDGDLGDQLRLHGVLYDSAPGSGNAYSVAALRRLMPIPTDARERHGADFFTVYGVSLLGKVATAGDKALGDYRVHRNRATQNLVFGNADTELHEPYRMYARHARLKSWIAERLGVGVTLAPPAPNFSLEKQGYALAIFGAKTYVEGLCAGAPLFASKVLPAIARVRESALRRAMLLGWALGVLLLPRRAGLPVARYVCNPASR